METGFMRGAGARSPFVRELDQLQEEVQRVHSCEARLAHSVPVTETHRGKVWEGVVHVFNISGHPSATRVYAWSSQIEGSDERRLFSVLHEGPVESPADALHAAMVPQDNDNRTGG